MSGELNFDIEKSADFVKVSLVGEVDIFTSKTLKEKLYGIVDENQVDLKLDCKDLRYIDSTGLGIFVGTLKKVKQNDKKIYVLNLKENIKKLFFITGLDKLFIIEE